MFSPSARTDFKNYSTVELDEFIEENRKFTKSTLSIGESDFEKAVREKSRRTRQAELQAKKLSQVNVELLQSQQEALHDILSELARPWYKTANGWFSFIAMTAAVAGVVLITI